MSNGVYWPYEILPGMSYAADIAESAQAAQIAQQARAYTGTLGMAAQYPPSIVSYAREIGYPLADISGYAGTWQQALETGYGQVPVAQVAPAQGVPAPYITPEPGADTEDEAQLMEMGLGALLPMLTKGFTGLRAAIAGIGAKTVPGMAGATVKQVAARAAGYGGVGYGVSEVVSGVEPDEPGTAMVPAGAGGLLPGYFAAGGIPSEMVAYTWNTGTAIFYRLIDGRIAVQKKNGVWKVYRPKKHIVVSSNPRMGNLIRADARIDRIFKRFGKAYNRRTGKGRTRTVAVSSKYLSPVEKAAMK